MSEEQQQERRLDPVLEAKRQRMEQRKRELAEREENFYRQQTVLVARQIELPAYQWEQLDRAAHDLSLTADQLVRVWIADKLIE